MFIPVFSDSSGYLSDNPGFNLADAEVHHSDPTKSSGSSTSSWDSALRPCILDE